MWFVSEDIKWSCIGQSVILAHDLDFRLCYTAADTGGRVSLWAPGAGRWAYGEVDKTAAVVGRGASQVKRSEDAELSIFRRTMLRESPHLLTCSACM